MAEKIVTTSCVHDCGGKCVLKAHVQDGVVVRITTDEGEEPQLRACLRGRAYRQRIYHPDRLKYPLKRVGERGEGKFERISWDEALDKVAEELKRVKESYDNSAILDAGGPGNMTLLHNTAGGVLTRFLNLWGGCTRFRGSMSNGATVAASRYTLGSIIAGNDPEDLVNSRLIILWSQNAAETINTTNTLWFITQAKEAGARLVGVDPRLTETIATLADQWIPIYPGTDAALMVAMAYVIIGENFQDKAFLDRHTVGFDRFRDYVLGQKDGTAKTPAWAEAITGVPRTTIVQLARDYATLKPAALLPGLGMQRTAYGEQPVRAAIALAAMTGNIGIPGGNPGGHYATVPAWPTSGGLGRLEAGSNPVKSTIPVNKWADAILRGKEGGYESDIKLVYSLGRNLLNQVPTMNKGVAALKKLDFLVVHEQFLTPTARFADILLPVTTWFERSDICLSGKYAIYMEQVIPPLYGGKADLEIFTLLSQRLGLEGYNDKTEEEWLRSFVAGTEIGDFDEFRRRGVHHFRRSQPYVAFREQIQDGKPFNTPSRKIEIYSQALADLNQPETIPAIPKYIAPWEGREDPLTAKYPLSLITPHTKQYTHSTLTNLPWLAELEPHALWIHPQDASPRGVKNGQPVQIWNGRGRVVTSALVTERIMPGVVSLDQGRWYAPDQEGTDRGGSANVLTRDEDTPLGDGATTHSCLVEVMAI
ncbi:MAG: molybdopterin-dependent oxidoreductase [Chloroflexi bacterium]|nr:molybdopterin-dependent oxidoreductase [Chloroflexota bacterium]